MPETAAGKMFCVAYGVLGIALGGVMLNVTSGYLSDKLLGLYKQRRARIDHLHHHDQTRSVFAFLGFCVSGNHGHH